MAYLDSILKAMNKEEEVIKDDNPGDPNNEVEQDKDKNPPKKDFYGDAFLELCKR